MPKPSSKRERLGHRPKPVKELTNLAISYWLWPPDEETTRALEVECPVCHQMCGLPCVRERSKLISDLVATGRVASLRVLPGRQVTASSNGGGDFYRSDGQILVAVLGQ